VIIRVILSGKRHLTQPLLTALLLLVVYVVLQIGHEGDLREGLRVALWDSQEEQDARHRRGSEALLQAELHQLANANRLIDQHLRTILTRSGASRVRLDVIHNGASKTISVNVGQLPNEQVASVAGNGGESQGRIGLALAPLSPDLRDQLDVPNGANGAVVREVEPLFGPMPDFEPTLRRNISRGTALCARDASGQVVGGVLLRAAPHTQITWLAVRASARRRGVGHALVAEVLRRWPPPCEVLVDTFELQRGEMKDPDLLFAAGRAGAALEALITVKAGALEEAVMSVEAIWKMKTEFGFP